MPYRGQTIGGCPHPMCGNVQRVRYITSSTIWRTTVSDSYLPPPTQLVLPPKSCTAHPHPPRPLRYSDSPSKGKAPKALMYIGRAPPRGTKRSAASVVQAEEQADQGNDEARKKKTKRQKAGKAVSRRSMHVVIQSPKIPTRKRRRIEEDTESSASEKSDEEEREEETSAEQWVGKGEARSITLLYCRYMHISSLTNRTGVSGAGDSIFLCASRSGIQSDLSRAKPVHAERRHAKRPTYGSKRLCWAIRNWSCGTGLPVVCLEYLGLTPCRLAFPRDLQQG